MSDEIDAYMMEQLLKGAKFDGDGATWSTNTAPSTATVPTIKEMLALVDSLPKRPFVNPDQRKGCGAILGEKFGGLVDTPAIPLHYMPSVPQPANAVPGVPIGLLAGPVVAYLCPACMSKLRERLKP